MASAGTVRRLYIDSRYKVSGSDSDFVIGLPVDVDCTRTSSFFVSSCSFANVFPTVTLENNKFYFVRKNSTTDQYTLYIATLPRGAYTPTSLAAAIKAATGFQSVTWDPDVGTFVVVFAASPANITWQITAYEDLDTIARDRAALGQLTVVDVTTSLIIPYPTDDKQESINALLNMPTFSNGGVNPWSNTSATTGIVDLAPLREIYLHCSLVNNRTLHVNGSRDCLARIPIDVAFGETVQYRHFGPPDALSCADQHFRTLSFQIRD